MKNFFRKAGRPFLIIILIIRLRFAGAKLTEERSLTDISAFNKTPIVRVLPNQMEVSNETQQIEKIKSESINKTKRELITMGKFPLVKSPIKPFQLKMESFEVPPVLVELVSIKEVKDKKWEFFEQQFSREFGVDNIRVKIPSGNFRIQSQVPTKRKPTCLIYSQIKFIIVEKIMYGKITDIPVSSQQFFKTGSIIRPYVVRSKDGRE